MRHPEAENQLDDLQIPAIVPAIAPPERCLSSVTLWLVCNEELVANPAELEKVPVCEAGSIVPEPVPVAEPGPECDPPPPCEPVCVHILAVLVLLVVIPVTLTTAPLCWVIILE